MSDLPHILVVDDDTRLRDLLQRYLSDNGFSVSSASSAAEARKLLAGITFDLIVLDVMMPEEDGLAFTEWLRPRNDVPILMLTARGEVQDRIAGFEKGVDDYLSKPFDPQELLLRITTILRRVQSSAPMEPLIDIQFGSCIYKSDRQELWQDGQRIHLTEMEASLLQSLVAELGNPVSRETLIQNSGISGGVRTVDVQVTRLRRKIEPNSRSPRYIQTVRGHGYVLRPD
ncbi:MAG: DNA-binding response regulator [Rhodospirillaceae bacterium]|nr:DNA-binding response regulator [Rhodospirillaceae bacterium]